MQRIILNAILLISSAVMLNACAGSSGDDVSQDPKYAHIYNQVFNTAGSLYYYHYTHSEGGKSGYFLSSDPQVPNAELQQELAAGSRVIVHKVMEVPAETGDANVMIQGKAFPNGGNNALDFLATWEDVKAALGANE